MAGLLLLGGASLGVVPPANNAMVMTAAPRSSSAVAGGMINVARALGTSIGVALTALGVRFGEAHGWTGPPLLQGGVTAACLLMRLIAAPSRRRTEPSSRRGNLRS